MIPGPLPDGMIGMGNKRICIDFDGTLYPFGPKLMDSSLRPFPDAVAAVRAFKAAGYDIVVLTSRVSRFWNRMAHRQGESQARHVQRMLDRDGIPFDEITADKHPADFYIDDRAIPFRNNWREIAEEILGHTLEGE